MYSFGEKSRQRLSGVHPDLVKVMQRAIQISTVDFRITEGIRTAERQAYLKGSGKSQTTRSRHLTGHAVDVVALPSGKVSWDWLYYFAIADAVKQAAKEVGVKVEWGGDWPSFKDGPHFQLPWAEYPAKA